MTTRTKVLTGKVAQINRERFFGFVAIDGDDGGDRFFHGRNQSKEHPFRELGPGQRVVCDDAPPSRLGPCVTNVRPLEEALEQLDEEVVDALVSGNR